MYATQVAGRSSGVKVLADVPPEAAHILTPDALRFISELELRSRARRRDLLVARKLRQGRLDAGERPDFLSETREIRESEWKIAPVPDDLQDRRVEITG